MKCRTADKTYTYVAWIKEMLDPEPSTDTDTHMPNNVNVPNVLLA